MKTSMPSQKLVLSLVLTQVEPGLELGLGVGMGVTMSGVTVSFQVLNDFPSETLHDLESDSLYALNDLPSDVSEA